jgi:hypothetical protein
MFEYSYNDHYKWGFNDNFFNRPEREGWFQVQLGSCERPHGTFREECINSARLLGERLDKPIRAGLSGGSDSQVVCLSLMEAGVPFTPTALRLNSMDGRFLNKFDIDGAFEFCEKHNLELDVVELDLDYWYTRRYMQLVNDYCIISPEISVQLYLVEKFRDTHCYINGGGDPMIFKKTDEDGVSSLCYELGPTPIEQYMMDEGIHGCLKFFMYTPEQIASYFDHPIFHMYNASRDSMRDLSSYGYFTNVIKPMMYAQEFPELISRVKNTGFEKYPFMQAVRHYTQRMNDYINPKAKMVKWKYEEILDHLNNGGGEVKVWRSIDEKTYYG